ncbi:hypothetical protein MPH_02887 [Macrophomina phaseolina MS6]|uniref:Uncharacterized protein n=1 Tax=Macrophomina phaseolina (strain MS6) TaxID=1126212 RepID=K2RYH1_MACPH|nr:hypothetical protein MPH_02887 [Macrophomina phaseolina MS6]
MQAAANRHGSAVGEMRHALGLVKAYPGVPSGCPNIWMSDTKPRKSGLIMGLWACNRFSEQFCKPNELRHILQGSPGLTIPLVLHETCSPDFCTSSPTARRCPNSRVEGLKHFRIICLPEHQMPEE